MKESAYRKTTERIDARFVEGPNGPLFCLTAFMDNLDYMGNVSEKQPQGISENNEKSGQHIVLFVPPFGEEVNLCRRFSSLLRIQLSTAGLYSVLPDFYGTGDSAGHFEEATWEMWQKDLELVVEKFCLVNKENEAAIELSIIAVRAGCLLAQHLLTSSFFIDKKIELKNIVFIQPELHGFDIVNRLFRARITAQRFSGNKTQTSADLWACIEREETVHAGGYALSSKLCKVLQDTHLQFNAPARFRRQVLFTLDQDIENQELTGWKVNSLPAKPFWLSYDIEPEPALLSTVAESIDR